MENNNLSYAIETLTDYFQYVHENISYLNTGQEEIGERLSYIENEETIHIVNSLPPTTLPNEWLMRNGANASYPQHYYYETNDESNEVFYEIPEEFSYNLVRTSEISNDYSDFIWDNYQNGRQYILIDNETNKGYDIYTFIKGQIDVVDDDIPAVVAEELVPQEPAEEPSDEPTPKEPAEEPSETIDYNEMPDVIHMLFDNDPYDILDNISEYNINENTPVILIRPNKNVELAHNGHIYLSRTNMTSKLFKYYYSGSYSGWYEWNCKITEVSSLDGYNIYAPPEIDPDTPSVQVPDVVYEGAPKVAIEPTPDESEEEPQVTTDLPRVAIEGGIREGGVQIETPPNLSTIYEFIVYSNESTHQTELYQYNRFDNIIYPMLEGSYQFVRKYPDPSSRQQGIWYIKIPNTTQRDLYDEYLFINGEYELLGTDYSMAIDDVNATIQDINETMDDHINQALKEAKKYPYTLQNVALMWTSPIDTSWYYDDDTQMLNEAGYTASNIELRLYRVDNDILYQLYNVDDTPIDYGNYKIYALYCIDNIRTATNAVRIYESRYYTVKLVNSNGDTYTHNFGDHLVPTSYWIINIDQNNQTFDIQNRYTDSDMYWDTELTGVSFSQIASNNNVYYHVKKYIKGTFTENVIQHESFFGNNVTQKTINDEITVSTLIFKKQYTKEGYVGEFDDHRYGGDDNYTAEYKQKFVPVSTSDITASDGTISYFYDVDGWVIENTVAGIKASASTAQWVRPLLTNDDADKYWNDTEGKYDPVPESTWSYIGSSEPFTGESDNIAYSFMWNQNDLSDAVLWRNTRIYNKSDDDNNGDGVHIAGYKLQDNIAAQFIKGLMNNNN